MWSKKNRLLLTGGVLGLIALAAVLAVFFLIPFLGAESAMDPQGVLTVRTLEDGTLQLQWPAGSNATGYEVQVCTAEGDVLHSARTEENSAAIPVMPEEEVEIRVSSLRQYGSRVRRGSEDLTAVLAQPVPRIRDLNTVTDTRFDTVDLSFELVGAQSCSVYVTAEGAEPVPVQQTQEGKCRLHFGVDDLFPVPEYGRSLQVTLVPEYTGKNLVYTGAATGFTLTREDFLGTVLTVEQTDNGNNCYTFTWNETKGEYYDVRLSEDGGETWSTIAYIPADRERSFTTPCLTAFTDYSLCIAAVGGKSVEKGQDAAVSPVLQLRTGEKLLYSTIWPLMDQPVYADPQGTQELGTAEAASAWCVLGQEGKYLKIRFQGQEGYINSDFCMINLPDYIGNLCQYNITNSYDSMYLVHEYGIRDVSGTVITGYENVRIKEGQYLAPLLFPVTQRLMAAALEARDQGYTLRIYDSYRPRKATEELYWKTRSILDHRVPEQTFSGKKVTDLYLVNWGPAEGEENAEGIDYGYLSYRRLMTNNGAYSLSNFLASGTSRHNYGVALDLTLVDGQGQELTMQSSMHDLSWYSSTERNNGHANTLRNIMVGAGFMGIRSEWWHYQDQQVYNSNRYVPLQEGVSWECWTADNNGWRYRLPDGSFHANCTQVIDGENYTFDENGYLVS